ncbi:ATP-dependent DNA helicase MPH1 [Cladorrhinum samala]|uniref:ATP-dependent DNA helicase n=1 Tax=Cladorrhinum samala TaxID=585594 RepID=A0AAV9I6T2_9PEZI|nr:ATP-dependent DNA helicase MPH1 [Cladorrhinum samala]
MDDDELFDDIPDEDMFLALTQATEAVVATANCAGNGAQPSVTSKAHLPRASRKNFRQTTLWGKTLQDDHARPSQPSANRPYRADLPPEVPTHHELDHNELHSWVYPLNLGPIRDYQFSIVKNGLFNNTLVALPTGLGKTFIAAAIMLNYFRWTKRGKIVFVAPTKPLASQQVQACLGIAGIPRSQATLLTGETPPVLREGEWENKRLFFMTPQTLMNDLSKGYADPKSIVLLVVDEAHRATGDYAYVKVIEFIRRFSKSFRILALTATPGSSVEGVQDVIDNLGISHVEIRTEESLDIRQYVHSRNIDTITFDPSDEMNEVRDLFSKAIKPLVDKLSAQNIYFGRDPMSLTTYGLMKSRSDWLAGPGKHANQGLKFAMFAVFSVLQSLAHSIKLLNFHGIRPFYANISEFRSSEEEKGGQGSKLKRQVLESEHFQKMMTMIEKWLKVDGFSGHPKLDYLCQTLVNHFIDAGEGSNTRAIVFSEYRDSAEEIVQLLNKQPLISATVFVGQADSKRSEGMKQKQQIETIEKFKNGQYNVLVATSIGEEGLDIGQVDLIVCYDASSSPIRMLQRMGRTGRKRAGNIVLLLMKGKEEDKFNDAKDNYQKMQQMICDGERFSFRHDLSTRIIPREIKPEVEKRLVEIPPENSQITSLPEPRKTAAGLRKKPAKKKFNMPDGVETGFIKASLFGKQLKPVPKPEPTEADFLVDVPELDKITLTQSQVAELGKLYKTMPSLRFDGGGFLECETINLRSHPEFQRALGPTVKVKHGKYTKRCVKLFKKLGGSQDFTEQFTKPYGDVDASRWEELSVQSFADDTDAGTSEEVRKPKKATQTRKVPQTKRATKTKTATKSAGVKRKVSQVLESASEGVTDEAEEGDSEQETPQARTSKTWKKNKTKTARGRNLEEIGDDCMRTSDMEETDGSDSGRDLQGFVVDDDASLFTSSAPQGSAGPTTQGSSAPSMRHKKRYKTTSMYKTPTPVKTKPFSARSVESDSAQDTDEEMPDIAVLAARIVSTKKAKPSTVLRLTDSDGDEEEDKDSPQITPKKSKKRRHLVVDSDDDDDDD